MGFKEIETLSLRRVLGISQETRRKYRQYFEEKYIQGRGGNEDLGYMG